MYQIGIVSRAGRDLICVRGELSRNTSFQIYTFTTAPKAVTVLRSGKLQALVVIVDSFSQKQLSLVDKIRDFHKDIPIIFMTTFPQVEMQDQVRKCRNTILLNTYNDLADLSGILKRLVAGMKVYNRNHKRQRALQSASLESDDRVGHGCLLDLAGGGARVRAFKNEYKRGDQFTLRIPLPYVRKTYVVRAEVIWNRSEPVTESHPTYSQLMGLKFLSVMG